MHINSLKKVVITALILRLIIAFAYEGTGDTGAVCSAGALLLEGKPVYDNPDVYLSLPPFGLHISAIFQYLGNVMHLPCHGVWKIPSVLSDIGITILIFLIAKKKLKKTSKTALHYAKWYAFNPVTLFISAYHGQQEAFWIFFILLAWYVLVFHRTLILSSVFTSIAIAYKFPSVLLLPALLLSIQRWKERFLYVIVIFILFSISLLPEIITVTSDVVNQTFLYASASGVWGISSIVAKITTFFNLNSNIVIYSNRLLLITLAITTLLYYIKNLNTNTLSFFHLITHVLLLFYILTPGFGFQYLLWIIPFLILSNRIVFLKIYTVFVTFAFLHTYGLFFAPLDTVLAFLQQKIYYKYEILYPYDLYFPIWILFIIYLALSKSGSSLQSNMRKN